MTPGASAKGSEIEPKMNQTYEHTAGHRWRPCAAIQVTLVLAASLLAAGCATSTIESRRQERLAAYTALPADQRALVDEGRIQIGMNADAVFISWGPPSEILESETPQGHTIVWIYHGQWMQETRYWTYREVAHDGAVFLERYLESDYYPRQYIRAEIAFSNGAVASWRTLPRPLP